MNLDVLIPSLFLPATVQLPQMFAPVPTVPALERLLARADRRIDTMPALVPWLCERWGVAAPYPIAPLLAEYDGLDASNDGWMFAEPVHLIPHRDRVELVPGRVLDLNVVETTALIDLLNSHFADRALQFFAPTPDRWYVRCSPSEVPDTTPPNAARTGSLAEFLPKSTGALNWRSLQNESQMLFFDHRINEARENAGKPTISGVWFWGGGVLPDLKKPTYSRVIASSVFAVQLAKKSGIETLPLSWDAVRQGRGSVLAVIESCGQLADSADLPAWRHELERLDREWFLPVSQALRRGDIRSLNILVPGHGSTRSFHVTRPKQLFRFWRVAGPLSSHA